MILTCPACATRYRVAEQEFEGSAGRTVRCANCGYMWREPAPAQQLPESLEPPAAAVRIADASGDNPPEAALGPVPRLDIPPDSRPARPRVRSLAGRTAALAVLVIAAAIAWVLLRGHFAADRQPAAPFTVAGDRSAAPVHSLSGLIIRQVTPARTSDGLVVEGEIANLGNVPRDVPRLHVTLQDPAEKEVQSETINPPKARLGPGETVHFETRLAHLPDAATAVAVTFASF
jgi:predicted Zn finger-like uncharacterized protein